MRAFLSILLISILMSKTVYTIFWQTFFILNQKEIAELECVNKDRPEMNCNGNCYLAKQLKKADQELTQKKSENQRSLENFKQVEGSVFIAEMETITFFQTDLSQKALAVNDAYSSNYCFLYSNRIFTPPRS